MPRGIPSGVTIDSVGRVVTKPCRIIIDIPNTVRFDWRTAKSLWTSVSGFELENKGFNHSPTYVWYKVDPLTNIPLESISDSAADIISKMPSSLESSEGIPLVIEEFQRQLNQLAREVYRLKSAKEPITREKRNILNRDIIDLRANYQKIAEAYR